MSEMLIRGGYVLSMDPALGDLPVGDVHVKGSRIAAVGERLEVSGTEVIDATESIIPRPYSKRHGASSSDFRAMGFIQAAESETYVF